MKDFQVDRLEKAVGLFEEANRRTFEEAQIDLETLRLDFMRSPVVDAKDKQLMQRANDLERDAKNLQLALSKLAERSQQRQAAAKDPLKQQIKERRKRFKPLGGNKNWIPL